MRRDAAPQSEGYTCSVLCSPRLPVPGSSWPWIWPTGTSLRIREFTKNPSSLLSYCTQFLSRRCYFGIYCISIRLNLIWTEDPFNVEYEIDLFEMPTFLLSEVIYECDESCNEVLVLVVVVDSLAQPRQRYFNRAYQFILIMLFMSAGAERWSRTDNPRAKNWFVSPGRNPLRDNSSLPCHAFILLIIYVRKMWCANTS